MCIQSMSRKLTFLMAVRAYNGISIERMPPAQASNLGGVILHGGGLSAVLGHFHVFSE